jgi:acyl-CoA dehydrogenase
MDFHYPPDLISLRDMLRRLVETDVRPLEMKFFTFGELDTAESARLEGIIQQMGLWGAGVPESAGGLGLELLALCVIEEELGKTFIPLSLGDVSPVLYACRPDQAAAYLEPVLAGERRAILAGREPSGALPADWTTEAQADGQSYCLEGVKILRALPGSQDFLVVYARAPEGLTAFLVDCDHPGLHLQMGDKIRLSLNACRVPEEAILGIPGQANRLGAEQNAHLWIRAGARKIGAAARLLETSIDYAQEWLSAGAPLSVRPAVQDALAALQIQIEAVRWLVVHAAWLSDSGQPAQLQAAQVRLATTSLLKRAADQATIAYGGPGPLPANYMRHLRRGQIPEQSHGLPLEIVRTALIQGWS